MENLYFIQLLFPSFSFKFFKMEEDYKRKSMEIQHKIEN